MSLLLSLSAGGWEHKVRFLFKCDLKQLYPHSGTYDIHYFDDEYRRTLSTTCKPSEKTLVDSVEEKFLFHSILLWNRKLFLTCNPSDKTLVDSVEKTLCRKDFGIQCQKDFSAPLVFYYGAESSF